MKAKLAIGALLVLLGAAAARAHGPTIAIGQDRVEPAAITIGPGTTIHFRNDDEMPGGRTVVADDESFRSPALAKDQGWHYIFAKPGVYPFHSAVLSNPGR